MLTKYLFELCKIPLQEKSPTAKKARTVQRT